MAALYIRVSTSDQAERYSLPSQLKALREKAAREGYIVPEENILPISIRARSHHAPHSTG